jgi:hypothetical protein
MDNFIISALISNDDSHVLNSELSSICSRYLQTQQAVYV